VGIPPARECKKVSQKAGQTGINMAFPLQSDGFLSAICIQIVFKHTILTHCLLMLLRFFFRRHKRVYNNNREGKSMRVQSALLPLLFAPLPALAAAFDGAELSLLWGIPFAMVLLSIAIGPLLMPRMWHHYFGTITAFWTLLFLVPLVAIYGFNAGVETVVHALVEEYIPFILLLLALYTISGGILVWGNLHGSPRLNTTILAIGTVLASFMGTTGAAMLLIRPLLNTNVERKHRVHTVLFAIFIVANCGGLLTPLGDPPLFLGLLRGVPFTWTFGLWPYWLFVNAILLFSYYALDRRIYATEAPEDVAFDRTHIEPLGVRGKINFLWFAVIIAAVAFAPSMDLHAIEVGHATAWSWVPVRELIMLAVTAASLLTTPRSVRHDDNEFSWAPIGEVAALFIGIFLTMIPALEFLGQQAPKLPLNEITFFLFTGGLSSVLDNALRTTSNIQ